MRKIISISLSFAVFAALTFTGVLQDVYAAETKETQALGPKVGNKLLELQELMNATPTQCGTAVPEADAMLGWKNLTAYEKVQIHNFIAVCYFRMDNINAALQSYENLMALGDAVPLGIQQSTLQVLTQHYLSQGNYPKGLDSVNRLMAIVPSPTADLWVLKGQAHYQAGQYAKVIQPIARAIELYKTQGRTPKENWLLMSRHAAYEQGDFNAFADFIRELIRYYPKDSYLHQLAGAYSQSGDNRKFLVLTEILYEGGYKTDAATIKNLAQLYLMEDVPHKAAKLLDKEIKAGRLSSDIDNKKLLATSWFQARDDDKAIPILQSAADESRDPEQYIRLTQSYMNIGQWQACTVAAQSAISNGIKNRQAAYTMLGLCNLELKDLNASKDAFQNAGGRESQAYLRYIEKEVERVAKLQSDLNVKGKVIKKNELLENTQIE